MNQHFEIHQLIETDLKYISRLTPEGWHDVTPVFRTHLNRNYFFPIKLILTHPKEESANEIIGVAELMINQKIGWLGNIIVQKEYRNQGLGKKITLELIRIAKEKGCESIYLLATSLGKYVYQKLGFQEKGKYLFYQKNKRETAIESYNNIFPYQVKYHNQIFELDKKAMGEDRSEILKHLLEGSFIYKNEEEKIEGFFIPHLGDGLTICNDEKTSFEFIKKREELGLEKIALPEENLAMNNLLKQRGYAECREPAIFMFLGKMKTWNPKMIVCRIGGYIG